MMGQGHKVTTHVKKLKFVSSVPGHKHKVPTKQLRSSTRHIPKLDLAYSGSRRYPKSTPLCPSKGGGGREVVAHTSTTWEEEP